MTNQDIFKQARLAADAAVSDKFATDVSVGKRDQQAIAYWKLVFDTVAAHLQKHVNGCY